MIMFEWNDYIFLAQTGNVQIQKKELYINRGYDIMNICWNGSDGRAIHS